MTMTRFINFALCLLIVGAAWFFRAETPTQAFSLPICGLFEGWRLASSATNNTICTGSQCAPSRTLSYKRCNVSCANWECLFNPGISVQCTSSCSELILDDDRVCQCEEEECPEEEEWDPVQCECVPVGYSPIIVSARGNGLDLTDAAGGVDFDLDGDGFLSLIHI